MTDASQAAETDRFLYHVTHDLKGYMRAIKVIPEWIAEDCAANDVSLPTDVTEHLDMLNHYVGSMDRLLEGLTELSRIGRISDAAARHDLGALIEGTWSQMDGADSAELTVMGNASVEGPANELDRLLKAVLSNAVEFNDADTPRVEARLSAEGERAQVTITDNGPGIPTEYRERMLEPLQTLTSRDETGRAGIGLAVATKVVMLLGGELSLGAPPDGRGCAVTFDLPLASCAA